MSNVTHRTKPVTTRYVHALHDETAGVVHVQDVDKSGKPIGKGLRQMPVAEFAEQYEPVLRKARAKHDGASHTHTPPPKK